MNFLLIVLAMLGTDQFGTNILSVSTNPAFVSPNEPFQIVVKANFVTCDNNGQNETVQANTIRLNLDLFTTPDCDALIFFPETVRTFTFPVEGLARGQYVIEVYENTNNIGVAPIYTSLTVIMTSDLIFADEFE